MEFIKIEKRHEAEKNKMAIIVEFCITKTNL
jgi:hypothetical protein